MGEGGQFDFGEFPEDLGDETAGTEPLRGWIAPEDRLWRHPSEMAAPSPSSAPGPRRGGAGRLGGKWSALAAGALGAAVVASAAVVVTGGSSTPVAGSHFAAATDTSLVTSPAGAAGNASSMTVGSDVASVVETMQGSLVTLLPQGSSSTEPATGVVLPGGDLVLTAASALASATTVVVETATGHRQTGTVEGVDIGSGVAVVRVPQSIPSAAFANEEVTPHQLVVAACRCSGAGGSPPWAVTMVHQVGTQATLDGGPALIDAIEAEMPLGPAAQGSVILDDDGQVLGILDGERTASGETFGYFVPAALAVGVAQELAVKHRVTRGWLGIVCADDGVAGATVTTVLPGSPAVVAGLRPGDVVEAVGSHRVGSLADLEALLYTTSPGTRLTLTVSRGGSLGDAPVTVAGSPS